MSKITRRDFLKTAGVMTLAVAAAGVLSGCDGAEKPVAPETGNKALGEITNIGKMEFSVVAACNQQNIQRTPNVSEGTFTDKVTGSHVCVLLSVRNTDLDAPFKFNNVSLYVNGKKVTPLYRNSSEVPAAVRKCYGVEKDTVIGKATGNEKIPATKEAGYYELYYTLTDADKDVYDDYKAITSLEVTYYDVSDKTAVTYTIPTPLTEAKIV